MEELKIVLISDTHGKHSRTEIDIPDGDMIICAGDVCSHGTLYEVERFICWFSSLPHKYKVFIAGNHCWPMQRIPEKVNDLLLKHSKSEIIYLNHNSCEVESIKIFGSPWSPAFYDWAFNYDRKEGEYLWKAIPDDTNILITHGPPYGILDYVEGGSKQSSWNDDDHVGCKALLNRVNQLKDLRLHVFGHIHCGRAVLENGKITFINASVLDEAYQPYTTKAFTYNY